MSSQWYALPDDYTTTVEWSNVEDKPTWATVAYTGDYSDLLYAPSYDNGSDTITVDALDSSSLVFGIGTGKTIVCSSGITCNKLTAPSIYSDSSAYLNQVGTGLIVTSNLTGTSGVISNFASNNVLLSSGLTCIDASTFVINNLGCYGNTIGCNLLETIGADVTNVVSSSGLIHYLESDLISVTDITCASGIVTSSLEVNEVAFGTMVGFGIQGTSGTFTNLLASSSITSSGIFRCSGSGAVIDNIGSTSSSSGCRFSAPVRVALGSNFNCARLQFEQSGYYSYCRCLTGNPTGNTRLTFLPTDTSGYALDVIITGDCYADAFNLNSDSRLKTGIQPVSSSGVLLDLTPVEYRLNNSSGRIHYGFIAQDFETYLPDLVQTGEDAPNYKSIDYMSIIALLVSAHQEQETRISTINAQLSDIQSRLAALESISL